MLDQATLHSDYMTKPFVHGSSAKIVHKRKPAHYMTDCGSYFPESICNRYWDSAEKAVDAGYRKCLRCWPQRPSRGELLAEVERLRALVGE